MCDGFIIDGLRCASPILRRVNPHTPVTHIDVIRYYQDIEESEKIHFCGWLDNNMQGKNVTEKNLNKTRRLMGQKVYEFAKRRNMSTRWTPEPEQSVAFYKPE